LISTVPGFIFASSAAFTSPLVSGLSATWTLTTSPRDTASAGVGASSMAMERSTVSIPISRASRSVSGRFSPSKRRLQMTTCIPKPAARRIISCPMLPTPSRTSVRP
jgi:hypothetical protein